MMKFGKNKKPPFLLSKFSNFIPLNNFCIIKIVSGGSDLNKTTKQGSETSIRLKDKIAIITDAAEIEGFCTANATRYVKGGTKIVNNLKEAGDEAVFVKTDVSFYQICSFKSCIISPHQSIGCGDGRA